MRYIIADKEQAVSAGFKIKGHRVKGNFIILNEKEVENNPSLSNAPTLETKCERITGTIYTHKQIIHQLNQEGWNNG